MAAAALIGSLALTAVGTGLQFKASQDAAEAQEAQVKAQERAEAARKQALEVETTRKRREFIRNSIVARSTALSQGVARGAQDSSVLEGAFGQIAGQTAFNVAGANLQQDFGNELFAASAQGLQGKRQEAQAGAQSALGGGISSLGGALGRNIGPINRLFG